MDNSETIAQGTWGDCVWSLTANHVLNVNPSPDITYPVAGNDVPWEAYKNNIVHVRTDRPFTLGSDTPSNLFSGCDHLTDIGGLDRWHLIGFDHNHKTTGIKSTADMFCGCHNLSNLHPLEKWDMRRVEDTHSMFYGCQSIYSAVALQNWHMPNCKNAQNMFFGCYKLVLAENLNGLFHGDTKIQNIDHMFDSCLRLVSTDFVKDWDLEKIPHHTGVFDNCPYVPSAEKYIPQASPNYVPAISNTQTPQTPQNQPKPVPAKRPVSKLVIQTHDIDPQRGVFYIKLSTDKTSGIDGGTYAVSLSEEGKHIHTIWDRNMAIWNGRKTNTGVVLKPVQADGSFGWPVVKDINDVIANADKTMHPTSKKNIKAPTPGQMTIDFDEEPAKNAHIDI